jgi:hypothetical protein
MSEQLYVHTEEIHNFSAAEQVLPVIIKMMSPKSILDVGCGIGTWLSVATNLGIKEILGIDGEHVDQELLRISKDNFQTYDLEKPFKLGRKFDILLCLEVAEHISTKSSEVLIESLTTHSDVIIFSAAIPGQDGQNHINEQWPEYYQNLFRKYDFDAFDILRNQFWNNTKVEWWYRQNMIVYAKANTLALKNFNPSIPIQSFVHPELLLLKNEKIKQLRELLFKEAAYPGFFISAKRLMKSIIKPRVLSREWKKLNKL